MFCIPQPSPDPGVAWTEGFVKKKKSLSKGFRLSARKTQKTFIF